MYFPVSFYFVFAFLSHFLSFSYFIPKLLAVTPPPLLVGVGWGKDIFYYIDHCDQENPDCPIEVEDPDTIGDLEEDPIGIADSGSTNFEYLESPSIVPDANVETDLGDPNIVADMEDPNIMTDINDHNIVADMDDPNIVADMDDPNSLAGLEDPNNAAASATREEHECKISRDFLPLLFHLKHPICPPDSCPNFV